MGVYSVLEPFEFGPTVQRAVLPLQSYEPIRNLTEFYMAGWGAIDNKGELTHLTDDLRARTVYKSSKIPTMLVDTDPRDVFYVADEKDCPLLTYDVGAPIFDIRTGTVVAISIFPHPYTNDIYYLIVVGTAAHRERIDKWMKELG